MVIFIFNKVGSCVIWLLLILSFVLIIIDVFHWSCLDEFARRLPLNTAPAGYACPACHTGLFPASNVVSPVIDSLRELLSTVNWARAGLGLPLVKYISSSACFKCLSQRGSAGGIMFLGCSCIHAFVRPCIRNVVNTISRKLSDHIFSWNSQHWCILGQGWMLQVLGSKCKRSKFKVLMGFNMLENAVFGLVNAIFWRLLDQRSPDFQHWCILGQGWTGEFFWVWVIQSLTLCFEFKFLVMCVYLYSTCCLVM